MRCVGVLRRLEREGEDEAAWGKVVGEVRCRKNCLVAGLSLLRVRLIQTSPLPSVGQTLYIGLQIALRLTRIWRT